MKMNFTKIAGVAEILIGLIVLALMLPTAIPMLMLPFAVLEFGGLNFAWLLGSVSLLGLGLIINGIVLVVGKK